MSLANARAVDAIRVGIVAGIFTCIAYPVILFVPLPDVLTITLAALLGPFLGIASWGLRAFVKLHRPSVAVDLAMISNILAGALLTTMLLVQIAVRNQAGEDSVGAPLVAVWLGIDVAWDTYVGLGTFLFGISFLGHPRLGRIMGGLGIVLSVLLLALNYWTFPLPPGETGLIDLGPLIGIWYLVATIIMIRSLSWVKGRVSS